MKFSVRTYVLRVEQCISDCSGQRYHFNQSLKIRATWYNNISEAIGRGSIDWLEMWVSVGLYSTYRNGYSHIRPNNNSTQAPDLVLCQDSSHKIPGGRENLTKLYGKELPGRQGYILKYNIVSTVKVKVQVKVTFSLYRPWLYEGSVSVAARFLKLGTRKKRVVSFTPRPIYSPKNSATPYWIGSCVSDPSSDIEGLETTGKIGQLEIAENRLFY
jgi:hypothetical protein